MTLEKIEKVENEFTLKFNNLESIVAERMKDPHKSLSVSSGNRPQSSKNQNQSQNQNKDPEEQENTIKPPKIDLESLKESNKSLVQKEKLERIDALIESLRNEHNRRLTIVEEKLKHNNSETSFNNLNGVLKANSRAGSRAGGRPNNKQETRGSFFKLKEGGMASNKISGANLSGEKAEVKFSVIEEDLKKLNVFRGEQEFRTNNIQESIKNLEKAINIQSDKLRQEIYGSSQNINDNLEQMRVEQRLIDLEKIVKDTKSDALMETIDTIKQDIRNIVNVQKDFIDSGKSNDKKPISKDTELGTLEAVKFELISAKSQNETLFKKIKILNEKVEDQDKEMKQSSMKTGNLISQKLRDFDLKKANTLK